LGPLASLTRVDACNPLLQAHPTWARDEHEGRGTSTSLTLDSGHLASPPFALAHALDPSGLGHAAHSLVGLGTPLSRNADSIECGVVGVFIALTTKRWSLEVCYRMAHRTLSGAPATSADRWGLTVEALTCGATGLSGGAPGRSCRLSGAPPAHALTSAHTVAH
jgi:hypothetical protein